jgi:segregation and condensation protein A
MNNSIYEVKLDNIFEGPMDLLVHLIRKSEVDIYDIPIAMVTDQYLAYIELMKSLNIDFAGDFLLMAATLTQIKSKMLLPIHEEEDESEDPRLEITRPLIEYLQLKSAAEELAKRDILGDHIFIRPASKDEVAMDNDDELIKVGLFELIDVFQKILENLSPDHRVDLTTDKITLKDRMTQIVDILEDKGSITLDELFEEASDKSDLIVTFLAILEMAKLSLIQIVQHSLSGIIRILYQ